jgi:hypothetical protein
MAAVKQVGRRPSPYWPTDGLCNPGTSISGHKKWLPFASSVAQDRSSGLLDLVIRMQIIYRSGEPDGEPERLSNASRQSLLAAITHQLVFFT